MLKIILIAIPVIIFAFVIKVSLRPAQFEQGLAQMKSVAEAAPTQ